MKEKRNDEFQMLTIDEWKLLDSLERIFQICDDVTVEINGEKYITISKVIVFIKIMDTKIHHFVADIELYAAMVMLKICSKL